MKTPLSRVSEVALSLGIPAVAFITISDRFDLEHIFPSALLILAAAVHVMAVNDHMFAPTSSDAVIRFLDSEHRLLKWGFPAFLALAVPFLPVTAILVLFTIFLWDFYSIYGKRGWISSLICNFLGGGAHFLIGVAWASRNSFAMFADSAAKLAPEALFFAFAMTAGAMHHESYDAAEDAESGYKTGAVRFSSDVWWRLAAIPMAVSVVPLAFSSVSSFRNCFRAAVSAYFALYAVLSLSPLPSTKPVFRLLCRVVFIAAAAAFAYLRITSILSN